MTLPDTITAMKISNVVHMEQQWQLLQPKLRANVLVHVRRRSNGDILPAFLAVITSFVGASRHRFWRSKVKRIIAVSLRKYLMYAFLKQAYSRCNIVFRLLSSLWLFLFCIRWFVFCIFYFDSKLTPCLSPGPTLQCWGENGLRFWIMVAFSFQILDVKKIIYWTLSSVDQWM